MTTEFWILVTLYGIVITVAVLFVIGLRKMTGTIEKKHKSPTSS
ncbi:MAG: hypothetical protein AAB601_02655 [Patescibacteria group bacterium]